MIGGDLKVAKISKEPKRKKRLSPAATPEARENQLISLAIDVAEEQLANGTASAQVITHYLKLGTTKERLEKEKLERENELLKAKAEMIQSQKDTERLYKEAIQAMQTYAGFGSSRLDDEEDL